MRPSCFLKVFTTVQQLSHKWETLKELSQNTKVFHTHLMFYAMQSPLDCLRFCIGDTGLKQVKLLKIVICC